MLIALTLIMGLLVLICPFILYRSTEPQRFNRQVHAVLLVWVGVTLLLTLGFREFDEKLSYNLNLFQCYRGLANQISYNWRTYRFSYNAEQFKIISTGICNILLNIILFMPYGYLMPELFSKRSFCLQKILLIGIIITLFIEMMQLVTHRGCFDLDDIFHNTLGVLLGYALGHYAVRGKY